MALPWPCAQAVHGLLTSQNAHFWLPVTPVPLSVCGPAGSPAARVLRVARAACADGHFISDHRARRATRRVR
jgi:hypothetical protein